MSALEYEIVAVGEYHPNPHTPCWAVDMVKPDGTEHRHVFPQDTLAWRAAEYGIDPADTDQLLDIVLHEPWAPHPEDTITADKDPVLAAGLMSPALESRGTVQAGDPVPTTLYTADTTEQAREAHLMRIQYAKDNVVRAAPRTGKADPLAAIKARGVDRSRVAAYEERVGMNRRQLRGERIQRTDPAPQEHTRDLRKREADRA
ncbi:hypothetical protein ACWEAF_05660 [Streptomyces sp. NPDC005071]